MRHHISIDTDYDGVDLFADVTYEMDERLDPASTSDSPPEYILTITSVTITECMAERDGVEVAWCEDYTQAVVDSLESETGADEIDDATVTVVEVSNG